MNAKCFSGPKAMREKQSYCCTSFFLFCCCFKQLNEISNVHNEQKCIDLIHGTDLLKMTGYLINQSRASSTCK